MHIFLSYWVDSINLRNSVTAQELTMKDMIKLTVSKPND